MLTNGFTLPKRSSPSFNSSTRSNTNQKAKNKPTASNQPSQLTQEWTSGTNSPSVATMVGNSPTQSSTEAPHGSSLYYSSLNDAPSSSSPNTNAALLGGTSSSSQSPHQQQHHNSSSFNLKKTLQNAYIHLRRRNFDLIATATGGNQFSRAQKKYNNNTESSTLTHQPLSFNFFYEHKAWTKESDRALRRKNLLLTIVALVGVFIMVLSNIVNFQWWHSETSNLSIFSPNARGPELIILQIVFQCLKCVNVLVTLFTLLALVNYYAYYAWVKKQRWGYLSRWSAFLKTSLLRKFFLEFIILSITPIPFVEVFYDFEFARSFIYKLDLFMFLKLYLLVRLVRDYSTVYRKRAKIIVANLDYKKFLPEFGWKLTFQMLFYNHTLAVLFVLAVGTTLIATFCIWIAERDTDNKALSTFYNALYFSLVTQMTIGYGDIVPIKTYGRVTALLQGLLGILLVTIFSGVVVNKLTPSDQQKAAVHYLTRERYMKQRLNEAVRILQVQWLYNKGKCSLNYRHNRIRTSMKNLQRIRRQLLKLRHQNTESTLADVLVRQQELKNSVHDLRETLDEMHALLRKKQEQEGGMKESSASKELLPSSEEDMESHGKASAVGGKEDTSSTASQPHSGEEEPNDNEAANEQGIEEEPLLDFADEDAE